MKNKCYITTYCILGEHGTWQGEGYERRSQWIPSIYHNKLEQFMEGLESQEGMSVCFAKKAGSLKKKRIFVENAIKTLQDKENMI